jgi:uncharacterized protein (TIGR04206 family)
MWVRSEYAGELAVLSAWLCALLPWSLSYASGDGVRLVRIHFLYLFFQFAPGAALSNLLDTYVLVTDAPSFPNSATVGFGYRLWALGAIVSTLLVAFSLVYYRYDERLEERSPIDPVRLVGGLLIASAVPLTGATYFVATGAIGTTVPVGVVFMYVFGGSLLVVERTPDPEGDATEGVGTGAAEPREGDASD